MSGRRRWRASKNGSPPRARWSGTARWGAFEVAPFDAATRAVAHRVAALTDAGTMLSVAGGGDTVAALRQAGVDGRLSYVSTAGGAFLEWLEGRVLPGVAALEAAARGGSAGDQGIRS